MENPQSASNNNGGTQTQNPTPAKSDANEDSFLCYPVKLQSDETNEEFEKTKSEVEGKFAELLTTLSEETLQLSEFLIEEKKLIHELCSALREILRSLSMNLEIPVKAVPDFAGKVKQVTLNDEGHLLLIHEDGKVISKLLENYPPQVILAVVWNVVPKLERFLRNYRRKISDRVGIFEKIRKELKNIRQVLASSEQGQDDVFIIGNEELKSPITEGKQQADSSAQT
jgi:hypothetical protein